MGSNQKIIISVIIAVIFLGIGAILLVSSNVPGREHDQFTPQENGKQTNSSFDPPALSADSVARTSGHQETTGSNSELANLELPFTISDISATAGEVNPLGVVRFSKDKEEYGHSGIDIPLEQGAPIYAVADGEIILVKSAGDPWGGQGMFQLLEQTGAGEGWVFVYEHITPAVGIKEGSVVKTGDLIATKTPPTGFTAHFQLSRAFNNFEFTRGMECWVEYLSASATAKLNSWWDERRTSKKLLDAWRTNDEEGKFPFRELLDVTMYPDGPQLCYPAGTDVR